MTQEELISLITVQLYVAIVQEKRDMPRETARLLAIQEARELLFAVAKERRAPP